jgi:spore maturation protein SpmA
MPPNCRETARASSFMDADADADYAFPAMTAAMTLLPGPIVAIIMFFAFWLASLFGAVLRERRHVTNDVFYATSAAVSLLVLLIGFTFSLALNRYDSRRALVVEEASAVHAIWRRLPLLPEAQRDKIARLTLDYADQRVTYFTHGIDEDKQLRADTAADIIADRMWMTVQGLPAAGGDPMVTRMMIDAMSRLDDVAWRREDMARAHIPRLVINLLVAFSLLTAISMGISAPRDKRVHPTHLIFFVLNAAAIMLVFDLDRPRIGLVQISQRPLIELQVIMQQSLPGDAGLATAPTAAGLTGDPGLTVPAEPGIDATTAARIAREQP